MTCALPIVAMLTEKSPTTLPTIEKLRCVHDEIIEFTGNTTKPTESSIEEIELGGVRLISPRFTCNHRH